MATTDLSLLYDQFQDACCDFQVPTLRSAAEVVLESYRQRPDALTVYQYILERAHIPMVQFQAASAITKVSIRDYSLYELDHLLRIKEYMIEYCKQRPLPQNYVREQILLAIAVITKRTFFDIPEQGRYTMLDQLKQMFSTEGFDSVLVVALSNALVDQFSSTRSTTVGLSWEFHYKCKVFFEDHFLPCMFEQTVARLNSLLSYAQHEDASITLHLTQTLTLAERILHWDFESVKMKRDMAGTFSREGAFEDEDEFDPEDGPSPVKIVFTVFPFHWQPYIGNHDILMLFFKLYSVIQDRDALAHRCRQCLLQFSGLKSDFFHNDTVAAYTYTTTVMEGTYKIMNDVLQKSRDPVTEGDIGPTLLSVIQMARRLIENTPIAVICQQPRFFQLLKDLGDLTLICLRGSGIEDGECWLVEAGDECLEIWVRLSEVAEARGTEENTYGMSPMESEQFGYYMKSFAPQMVGAYVDAHLDKVNASLSYGDEDEDEIEEGMGNGFRDWEMYTDQLSCIGMLARLNLEMTLSNFEIRLDFYCKQLKEYLTSKEMVDSRMLTTLHESMHWLLLIIAHTLAEAGKGEQPMIPKSIMLFSGAWDIHHDPVVRISKKVMDLLGFTSSFDRYSVEASNCSPCVASTLAWWMERWTKSYLLINENEYDYISPNIAHAFGVPGPSDGHGLDVIEFTIDQIGNNFSLWSADQDVLLQFINWLEVCGTCSNTRKYLLQSERFPCLIHLLTKDIDHLPNDIDVCLIQTLATVSSSTNDSTVKNNYFGLIFTLIENRLGAVLQHPEFQRNFQQARFLHPIKNVFEMLEGLALACQYNNSQIIFEFCTRHFDSFVQLMALYKDIRQIQIAILLFFRHLAEKLDPVMLEQEQKQLFFRVLVEMIRSFGIANQGRQRLHDEEKYNDVPYEDISTVIDLLLGLMASEFEDFERNPTEKGRFVSSSDHSSVAHVILFGVHTLLPLVDQVMLNYPLLSRNYLKLIAQWVGGFPEKLDTLPSDRLAQVMAILDQGIRGPVTDAALTALRAITPLALWVHVQQPNAYDALSSLPQALVLFLEHIIKLLLFEHLDPYIMDAVTDTFLTLICTQRENYKILVNQMIAQQPVNCQSRLLYAFETLDRVTPKQLPGTLPVTRHAPGFKEALLVFLMDTRAMLRVK
ncbi:armadillo-type protein [Spinellus fusiger]|nr:armadillo-type protein [Spinellus fusiger]